MIVAPYSLIWIPDNIEVTKDNPGQSTREGKKIFPQISSLHVVICPINKSDQEIMPLLDSMDLTMYELVGHYEHCDSQHSRIPSQQYSPYRSMYTIISSLPMRADVIGYSPNIGRFNLMLNQANQRQLIFVQKILCCFLFNGVMKTTQIPGTKMDRRAMHKNHKKKHIDI